MNYIRELESNRGFRESLKRVFRNIDNRIKEKEETNDETPTEPTQPTEPTEIKNILTVNGNDYELTVTNFEANGSLPRGYSQIVHYTLKSTTSNEYITNLVAEDNHFVSIFVQNNVKQKETSNPSDYTINGNDIAVQCGGEMSYAYHVEENDIITFKVAYKNENEMTNPTDDYENQAEITWTYNG